MAHKRLFLENLEQLQKCAEKKKSREFPLGGPSPCGKTGLAPCRQCTLSLFFFILWYPKSKLRPPKSPPKACLPNSFFPKGSKIRTPSYRSYQKKTNKIGSCKVRLINICFLKIWNKLQKCTEKNSREFPLGGPSPCGKARLAPCRQCGFLFSSSFFGIQNPNSDLQNHLPKRVCPTASSPKAQKFEPLLPILPQKKDKQNWELQSLAHKRLILENLEQLQKCAGKNSRGFS